MPEHNHTNALKELDWSLQHYCNTGTFREAYMRAYTQTNFYFGVIIAAFGLSMWHDISWLFVFIPFLVFVQLSIVQYNQYNEFLLNVYLCDLENKLTARVKARTQVGSLIRYFGFHDTLFDQTCLVRGKSPGLPFIKPTMLLSAALLVVNWAIIGYSCFQAWGFFRARTGGYAVPILYISLMSLFFILIHYNFVIMPKRIKPILREVLQEACE
jgi:hypothetical protein